VPGAVACLLLGAGACSAGHEPVPSAPPLGQVGNVGLEPVEVGGAGPLAPTISIDPSVACQAPPVSDPIFAAQVFDMSRPARRELFSWTTAEQAAALRQDKQLFTHVEAQGLGPGFAFIYLQQLSVDSTRSERAQLASILSGELFAKKRYAWTEPWATRMGWPGEDYGDQLLRIVLKPEAWVVLVQGGELVVIDQDNASVPLAQAIANPQRLGAIFYRKDAQVGGPECFSTFTSGSNGYREFILGNLAMVEEWSIGTQAIRDRLTANIEQLTRFLARIRSCPVVSSGARWNHDVSCSWGSELSLPLSDVTAYQQALAIPSDLYLPVPAQLAAMIETLQGDLFEPDPLRVNPGSL